MSAGFDSFNFAGNDEWKSIENNLYFSSNDPAENDRILLKRKRKWYKANIDESYEIPVEQGQQTYGNKQDQPKPAAAESPKASYQVPPQSQSSYSAPNASAAAPKSPYLVYVSYVQLVLHVLQLICACCYILPLAGVEAQSGMFFYLMLLNLTAQAVYLLRQHGRPRWNSEYGRVMFMDEQAHFFFLSIVLINATPSFILLLPFVSRSLLFVCGGLKQILPKASPKAYALVSGPIEKVVSMYSYIFATNALLEVIAGFVVILQIVTPSRNLMLVLGLWQYLRIRYMLSDDSKKAFNTVRVRLDGWVAHPMVPGYGEEWICEGAVEVG